MTARTRIICIAALACGAALLRFSFVNSNAGNWTPVRLPFPGQHLAVSERFHLESGGKFQLELITPGVANGKGEDGADHPPQAAHLIVYLSGPGRISLTRVIRSFRFASAGPQATYVGVEGQFEFPTGGDYEIAIKNQLSIRRFQERGASLQLSRLSPVGPEFLYPVARWAAYAMFVSVIAAMLWRRVSGS